MTWDGGHHGLPAYEIIEGVAVYRLKERWIEWYGKKRLSGLWMAFTMLHFLLSRRKYIKIVHVHAFTELAFFAKLWCRLIGIVCIAKVTGIGSIHEGVSLRRGLLGKILWYFMTRNGWVIAATPYIKGLLRSCGVPEKRIFILNNGVELPKEISYRENHNNTRLTIVALSSLISTKRIDLFVKAAKILSKDYPDILWKIAGDGPERLSLERLCASMDLEDKITWLGYIDDVGRLLRDADIFIHPSEKEGMCNSVLEAMAWGLPVIVRKAEFNSLLVEDEITGLTFDGTEQNLAYCVNRLCNDPDLRKKLGQSAREYVGANFSFLKTIKQYAELLRKTGLGSTAEKLDA